MKIEVNTHNWDCECCGSGAHWDVTLYDDLGKRLWGTSQNDQFGGTYRDGDDDTCNFRDWEDLVAAMKIALEAVGYSVYVEEHIDDSEPWNDLDWKDEDE